MRRFGSRFRVSYRTASTDGGVAPPQSRRNEMRKPWRFALALLAFVAATRTPVAAQVLVPPSPEPVTSPVVTVNGGPGEQTDPHVNGDLATYTDQGLRIHYFTFPNGPDLTVPRAGFWDILPDISNGRIVFTSVAVGLGRIM